MKRAFWTLAIVVLALTLGFEMGVKAAIKTYQFTGTVKVADAGTLTVEKSAKEIWTFATDKDTKGTPKVGDKVTVTYKMVATDVESKPATPPAAKKSPKD